MTNEIIFCVITISMKMKFRRCNRDIARNYSFCEHFRGRPRPSHHLIQRSESRKTSSVDYSILNYIDYSCISYLVQDVVLQSAAMASASSSSGLAAVLDGGLSTTVAHRTLLRAVHDRVERFDRRGTEPFEPFEPFEFFQNRIK